jgi:hypothetical protein
MDDAFEVRPSNGRWTVACGEQIGTLEFPTRLDAVEVAREAALTAGVAVVHFGLSGAEVYRAPAIMA